MAKQKLKIVHCFRSPVGGIFRHVRDLVEQQSKDGHEVGILCDSSTGGAYEDKLFEEIRPQLALGITRIPMRRSISPSDILTLWKASKEIKKLQPDILHSHSAKGGAYARIIGSALRVSGNRVARLYCPHGGSIHYDAKSIKGRIFFVIERLFESLTDRLIFVSKYEQDGYSEKVGEPKCAVSLVYNGLSKEEFLPVKPDKDAADFLYIGMMRDLKGPDVFLNALAKLQTGKTGPTAHFVGDGPDKDNYIKQIAELGLSEKVTVHDAMPAREAFAMAKCVVVPSRAESMPYIVLEAVAASKPIICTNVGGIPEIFDTELDTLVEAGNSDALAASFKKMLANKNALSQAKESMQRLKERFSVEVMSKNIMQAYRDSMQQS
ncbi:MAG: glycosyltransferase family 4 protein [Nitratireductor sp.]